MRLSMRLVNQETGEDLGDALKKGSGDGNKKSSENAAT